MKAIILSISVFLLTAVSLFGQSKKELRAEIQQLKEEIIELKKPKEINLNDENEKGSYALGLVVASNMQAQGLDSLKLEAIKSAFEDVILKKQLKIDLEEAEGVVQAYVEQAMAVKQEKLKEESLTFLSENRSKEGVIETESGLQYEIIANGTGTSPKAGDRVTVHYTGKLTNGTVFDSSVERGEPVTFATNQVIPGWTEALQLMKEGDKWILYIPYDLAYGERGAGGQIPPYATLIFEVELLGVNE